MDGLTVTFDPGRVRAIVVGLESYAGWEMSGPVPDALRFCAWLLSRGVVPDRIDLWLSVSRARAAEAEERAASLGIAWQQARSRDQLMDVFTRDLEERDNHDTLFLFWGGHGMEYGDDRVLFTPDATTDNPRCLAFGDLRRHLASRRFRSTRQVMFVDACGQFFNPAQSEVPPVVAPFPQGPRRGVDSVAQYSLLAAAPGQSAVNDAAIESGLFSRVVLDWLEARTEGRHIDLVALSDAVRERLEYEALHDRQTPVHVWAWTGDDSRRLLYTPSVGPEEEGLPHAIWRLARESRRLLKGELATLLDRGTIELSWTAVLPGVSPETTEGTGHAVAAGLRDRSPSGQLVVVGGPGMGKSVMLHQIARELVADSSRGGRIPVVFPLATWNPQLVTLTDWMHICLRESHKELVTSLSRSGGAAALDQLLERCLPVLDGFDEIPRNLRELAQQQLNTFCGPVILSIRADAHEQALASRALLPDAVLLRIQPLGAENARVYLADERKHGRAATRWKQHFESLDADHGSCGNGCRGNGSTSRDCQLSAVLPYLDSPLMLWLAGIVYAGSAADRAGTGQDATALASGDADHEEVAEQLLSKLVHAMFFRALGNPEREGADRAKRTDPEAAERWLCFLAAGLPEQGDREIGWWKITGLAPVRTIGAVIATAAGLLLGLLNHVLPHLVLCVVHGLLFGLLFGACYGGAYSARRASWAGRAAGRYGYGGAVAGTDTDPTLYRRHVRDGLMQILCLAVPVVLVAPDSVGEPLALSASLAAGSVSAAVVGMAGGEVTARVLRHFGKFDATVAGARAPTPAEAVRRDGFATLCFAILSFMVCAGALMVAMPRLNGSGVPSMACGALASTVTACLMFNAWPGYRVAHAWLAASEDLPWEFMAFLGEAHRLGVLRQHSISYIFRHDRLAEVLAERHTTVWRPAA
ncbi:NACHT domain-containing protein [Streptomyces sp. NPDC057620]|uniref:NACHT domain-containing protein n=1 Tax=Streptomyces sp. NPDC057620 TaxID=3346185 RepID=UPI0036CA6AB7